MIQRARTKWLAAAGVLALAAGTPAMAQEAESATVEELVVTAQLREQAPVEIPFALTTYSGGFLDRMGLQDFAELSAFVPGFEVQNQSPNNPGFVMRGITSDSGEATNEPRVSVFQDGISISKSRGSYVELFDVERVEVAKGPQSTLYGRGALIGGVNIIQNKARPGVFALSGRAEGGDDNYGLAEGVMNIPLGESAGVRFAARYKHRDGYVDNLLGGADYDAVDTQAYRLALNWTPSEALRLDLIGNYQKDQPEGGTSFKSLAYRPTDPATGAVLGDSAPWNGAALAAAPGFEGGKGLGLDRDVWGVTLLGRYRISPAWTANLTSGYREFDSLEVFDADGVSLPALTAAEDASGEQWSHELRFNFAPDGGRFSGFVGVSAFHESGSQRTPSQFDERVLLARLAGALNGGGAIPGRPVTDPAPAALFGQTTFTGQLLQGVAQAYGVALAPQLAQGIAANLKPNHLETATNRGETDSVDVFADITFKATERLELGLGVRYSHDDKTSAFSSAVLNGRSILGGFIGALGQAEPTRTALLTALAAPGAATMPTSASYPVPMFGLGTQPTANNGATGAQDLTDEGVTWRATARYALSEATSLYANYGRGRRPEVLAARPPGLPGGAPSFSTLDAEMVDSFEAGAKHQTPDGRLSLDGAVFYYKYKNFQTTEQVGTTFVPTNAGEATTYGFEGQVKFAASDRLDLYATYAFNHGRFDTGIREGNHFRLSPDHSLSLAAAWRAPLLGGEVEVRPSYTWQSKVFFDDDNDLPSLQQPPRALIADNLQDEAQKSYGLVNLRIDFRPGNGDWTIGAFANNLLDEHYLKDAGNVGDSLGMPTFIAGEPRLVGVSVAFKR